MLIIKILQSYNESTRNYERLKTRSSNLTTVLILKALGTEEKMNVAQTNNGNFFASFQTIQYLLSSSPKHIPASQIIREIQALIDNRVIKLVDQVNIPKDFEDNDN